MKEGLHFSRTIVQGVARVFASTARALKTDMLKMFDEAWLARSVAIYRARSERMIDYVDQRLRVGPNGAAWMTPEDLYFFRQFNPIFLRQVEKDLSLLPTAQVDREAPAARRVARAGSTVLASAAVTRRRRRGTGTSATPTKAKTDDRKG